MPHRQSRILSEEPGVDFDRKFLLPTIQAVTEPTQQDIERFRAAGQQPTQFEEALECNTLGTRKLMEAIGRRAAELIPTPEPQEILPAAMTAFIPGVAGAVKGVVTATERLASQAALGANVFHGTGLPPKGP
ncbi:MAG: hypothetical protein ACYTG7_25900, partial [Planctomycetota bacterium]